MGFHGLNSFDKHLRSKAAGEGARPTHTWAESYVAQIYGFAQRGQRIAGGHELVRHVALVTGGGDAAHHSIPLHFLGAVEFMPAGNAAGVEVGQPLNVLLNGRDQVSFHDLHVVDVVEQLDVR